MKTPRRTRRPRSVQAVVSLLVGAALILPSAGTRAAWTLGTGLGTGALTAGQATFATAAPRSVTLQSRQPAGTRAFASASSCTPDAGFVECRVVTGTLANERLMPGDRLVATDEVTFALTGDRLTGTLSLTPPVVTGGVDVGEAVTIARTVRAPQWGTYTLADDGLTLSTPVQPGVGNGTYALQAVVDLASVDRCCLAWGTRLQGQALRIDPGQGTFAQD